MNALGVCGFGGCDADGLGATALQIGESVGGRAGSCGMGLGAH